MKLVRRIGLLMAVCLVVLCACGCGGGEAKPTPTPAPTLPPSDSLSIKGKVDLTVNGKNEYVVTCTSDVPEGAILTIDLYDDLGNMLASTNDVIQRGGVCSATFDRGEVDQTARANGATAVMARVEFFPSNKNQPIAIREGYGEKGARLAGDNVVLDDTTGATGVRMESAPRDLQ